MIDFKQIKRKNDILKQQNHIIPTQSNKILIAIL